MIINFANLGGGGGGGTTNYNQLTNKPQINSITLTGNTTLDTLGVEKKVIELTQAQYDALATKETDVTYIITDATGIDMSQYVTNTTFATFSATTTTAIAGKASKQNIDAQTNPGYYNTQYLPNWNSEGVITGKGQALSCGFSQINGSYKHIVTTNNSTISIYAPTTNGTQNQLLLSSGSGAPVWSSSKIVFCTQSEYDALATKDETTLYIITGD